MSGLNQATVKRLDDRRRRLGMSRAALAKRALISPATVTRVLTGKETSPGVATLQALAVALKVDFIVGQEADFREQIAVEEYQLQQATEKAGRLVALVQGTMALESQGVDEGAVSRMVKQTIHELMAGSKRNLWC